jgi:hypothetical protein
LFDHAKEKTTDFEATLFQAQNIGDEELQLECLMYAV